MSGSHPVESTGFCLDGSSGSRSGYRRGEAMGPNSCWMKNSLGVFNPLFLCTVHIGQAGLFISSAFLCGVASSFRPCLDFSIYPRFFVLEISPGLGVVGAKRRLVLWIMR